MAVDLADVCASAESGSQSLAIVLSVAFSLYTIVTIVLSGLTIYSVSQAPVPASIVRATPLIAVG